MDVVCSDNGEGSPGATLSEVFKLSPDVRSRVDRRVPTDTDPGFEGSSAKVDFSVRSSPSCFADLLPRFAVIEAEATGPSESVSAVFDLSLKR